MAAAELVSFPDRLAPKSRLLRFKDLARRSHRNQPVLTQRNEPRPGVATIMSIVSGYAPAHGSMISIPISSKSPMFLVATAMPRERAIAAI